MPEAERPLTALPGLVPTKLNAGTCSVEQIQVVQEVLEATASQVPPDAPQPP